MKRLALFLLLATIPAVCQVTNKPNTVSIEATGSPSGACGNNFVYTNKSTGDFYNCKAGAWNKVTGAGGGSGTVTNIATTSPIGGGPITTTGTLTCATCVVASSPGAGVAHFAGATQTTTSSLIVAADITSGTITPTQLAASATPAIVQLETHAAAASAELDFTTCLTNSSYHDFLIEIRGFIPATNATQPFIQASTDGGATYLATTNYDWAISDVAFTTPAVSGFSGLATSGIGLWLGGAEGLSNAGTPSMVSTMELYDPASASNFKLLRGQSMVLDANGSVWFGATNFGRVKTTTAVNAFRVIMSSGNITAGTVTCYGVTP